MLREVTQITQPLRLSKDPISLSTKTYFVPCGSFQSLSQKQLVYAGVKFPISEEFSMEDFYRALTNISLTAQKRPELAHQLPLFYGILVSPNHKPKGIITQDFSSRGQHNVKEYKQFPHANIPDGLIELFDPFGRGMTQIERALFYVNGTRKIGDLDHLFPKGKYQQDWAKIKERLTSENPIVSFSSLSLEQLFTDELELRYANLVIEACKEGPKSHIEVIHVDPQYRINTSTTQNKILDSLVDNLYLDMWRDEKHYCKDKVFTLA